MRRELFTIRPMNNKPQGYRAPWHDYRQPWFYMITMTTFNRKPIFGKCEGGKSIPSKDGWLMYELWRDMPKKFPQLETSSFAIMPDHIHGIIRVREYMEKPLGVPLRVFKSLTTSALREKYQDPVLQVWAPGYHDWFSKNAAALKAFSAYIRDNPRRYCLKQQHPDLFTRTDTLTHPRLPQNQQWHGYGNLFLLDRPVIIPLRVSRRATPEEMQNIKNEILREVAAGAVVVSPFISPGEKEIALMILGMEYGDVILMRPDGFPKNFRPNGKYYDLCANGRLLILSAFSIAEEPSLTKARCEQMNAWCRDIADGVCHVA